MFVKITRGKGIGLIAELIKSMTRGRTLVRTARPFPLDFIVKGKDTFRSLTSTEEFLRES